MGRTRRLIDAMIAAVEEGQPLTVIVCANDEHADYLLHRTCSTLLEMEVRFILARDRQTLFIDGSRIDFVSVYEIDVWRVGHPGYGEFWSEFGEWIYDKYVDKTDKEVFGN